MNFFSYFASLFSHLLKKNKSLFEKFYLYTLLLLISYAVADLSLLSVRPLFLPKKTLQPIRKKKRKSPLESNLYYNSILARNVFNEKGIIPPALSEKKSLEEDPGTIVFSKLPLKLVGTIVHMNPKRSVVTIGFKRKRKVGAYKVGENIDQMAKILKVERKKVIFRNLKNSRMEYLEIPDELKIEWLSQPKGDSSLKGKEDSKLSFSISKSVFDAYKQNLHSILGEAQVIPVESASGEVGGFKFAWIKKGSVYEKLGFRKGDIIKQVNGEAVNSPSEGLKLYNSLKNSDQVSLLIVRDGKEKTFEYQIKD